MDVYKLNDYKYTNNDLPHNFQILSLNASYSIHSHKTRHQDNIHIRRANHKFANTCIRHAIPVLIDSTESEIK